MMFIERVHCDKLNIIHPVYIVILLVVGLFTYSSGCETGVFSIDFNSAFVLFNSIAQDDLLYFFEHFIIINIFIISCCCYMIRQYIHQAFIDLMCVAWRSFVNLSTKYDF